MSAADTLLDTLADVSASARMSKATIGWSLSVSSVEGGFLVRIEVDGLLVARVHDAWLERGVRKATAELESWRETSEAMALAIALEASVEMAEGERVANANGVTP